MLKPTSWSALPSGE